MKTLLILLFFTSLSYSNDDTTIQTIVIHGTKMKLKSMEEVEDCKVRSEWIKQEKGGYVVVSPCEYMGLVVYTRQVD